MQDLLIFLILSYSEWLKTDIYLYQKTNYTIFNKLPILLIILITLNKLITLRNLNFKKLLS